MSAHGGQEAPVHQDIHMYEGVAEGADSYQVHSDHIYIKVH